MRDFQSPGRSMVMAAEGMCATSHPLAALVAVETLKSGGTAADAAVAAGVLLGLAEPQMTGLGGDMFALVKPMGAEDVIALNGSGRAPAGLDAEALRAAGHRTMPPHAAASVTLPGAVAGFAALADRFGRLGFDRLLAPAIHYAEAGIPVAPRVAFDWAREAGHLDPAARRHFLPGGTAPQAGTRFRAPAQAAVLRAIAAEGPRGFYEGAVALDMVTALRDAGGAHTEADFAEVTVDWGAPISGAYAGADLIEHPPNGQGATALLLANILTALGPPQRDPLGPDRVHLEAEAVKLAHDARDRFIADPDHAQRLDHLCAPETGAKLAALIDPTRAVPDFARQAEAVHRDTVYLTVVDRDRMAVSLIASIYHAFGSGIAAPGTGVLFHNRGAGFTLTEGHPNEAAAGKRPMHTIIPAMLRENGRVSMSFGVMGGAYQPTGHLRLISNMRDYGMDAQTAIDAPRAFWSDGTLRLERGYPDSVARDLERRGHRVMRMDAPIGGAQAIVVGGDGTLTGASDPRKDGCALGY